MVNGLRIGLVNALSTTAPHATTRTHRDLKNDSRQPIRRQRNKGEIS